MTTPPDILVEIVEESPMWLPRLRANAADPEKDRDGCCSCTVQGRLQAYGVARYVIHNDKAVLLESLRESASIMLRLFERFEAAEPIARSLVGLLSYKQLYDALASGDLEMARRLAGHMGRDEEWERKHNHPYDVAFGYCTRDFVLNLREQWPARVEALAAQCEKTSRSFRGYARVFEAIQEGDSRKANAGFVELLKGHRRLCKGNGVLRQSVYEDMCIWGLGLANLAGSYGLDMQIEDPLIPSELIIKS